MGLLDAMMPEKPNLGTGMAGNAQRDLSGRGYQLYLKEAQALGERPLTLEQWVRMQGSK